MVVSVVAVMGNFFRSSFFVGYDTFFFVIARAPFIPPPPIRPPTASTPLTLLRLQRFNCTPRIRSRMWASPRRKMS